ncbi:unnamed protein product, partial [Cyprideis torosa]
MPTYLNFPFASIPYSVSLTHFFIALVGLVTSRLVFKTLYNRIILRSATLTRRVLIYGTDRVAVMTTRALEMDEKVRYQIVGYIDKKSSRTKINGYRVYQLKKIEKEDLKDWHIDDVIIADRSLSPKFIRILTDRFLEQGIKVKLVPPPEKWWQGKLKASQIKDLDINDLLGRKRIVLNNPKLEQEFRGKTVLVTGGAGSIGSEITRQVMAHGCKRLLVLDMAESPLYDLEQELKRIGMQFEVLVSDVRNERRMQEVFEKYRPDIVFHAAAYKHVPLMEQNPEEAFRTNVLGTQIVADLSLRFEVEKFVFVSTDKAVNPTSVMGASKRLAEMYVSCCHNNQKTRFITTRFGNVLGSNGSVVPLFTKQIQEGGPITVTHKEITRFFMTIPEACQLVLEAGVMGAGGEIFIFDMGESVKIYDLAKKMIRLSGLRYPEDIDIDIIGLRPGEKIYEELLADGEQTLETYHEKIRLAKSRQLDCALVKSRITFIKEGLCAGEINNMELITHFKDLIPEYLSNNSEYERLDNPKRREEAAISSVYVPDKVKIIDRAFGAAGPISPKKNVIYLAALLLGLLIPFALIYLRQLLDHKYFGYFINQISSGRFRIGLCEIVDGGTAFTPRDIGRKDQGGNLLWMTLSYLYGFCCIGTNFTSALR